MNFEKFDFLKQKIEKLPNVKFYSFNEDTVIIQHDKSQALYQIPFVLQEDDSLTLELSKGMKVKEGIPTKEQQFQIYKDKLKINVKSIFENFDEGLKSIKDSLKTFPNFNVNEFENELKAKNNAFVETIDFFAKSEFEPIKNINTKFKKQLVEMQEDKKEFVELLNIFEDNGELKTHDLNYDNIKNMYVEHMMEYESFNEHLKKISKFHKKVEKVIGDENISNEIIKKLNFDEDIKIAVPKTLIKVFKSYTEEVDLNIKDVSKKIIDIYNEEGFATGTEAPFIYNRHVIAPDAVPKFLKFSTGKYTAMDAETLAHELEQSYYILPDLTHEDLIQIADWKNQCEYMSRTGMISDKKMDEIINDFNKRFTVDQNARYNDGDLALGFKDNQEKSMGNETGMAYDGSVVPDDEIIDEIEYDDEEDFEVVKGAEIV